MMKVKELAQAAEVSSDVVRYYAKIGLLSPSKNEINGYKQFDRSHLRDLNFIRQAKSLGFTLKEIQDILLESRKGESPCPNVRHIIKHRIIENRRKLQELQALQDRMEQALVQWDAMPDGYPDGNTVCHLIETSQSDQHKQGKV